MHVCGMLEKKKQLMIIKYTPLKCNEEKRVRTEIEIYFSVLIQSLSTLDIIIRS